MRTWGSSASSPRSRTWPSTWPLAFCERALPRCAPNPKNAVAAMRWLQRQAGRPRISRKPRPLKTSSRTRALSFAPSDGSGKSTAEIAAMSASRATSGATACSISRISVDASGISHSSRAAISGPYQAAAPVCSGGRMSDIRPPRPKIAWRRGGSLIRGRQIQLHLQSAERGPAQRQGAAIERRKVERDGEAEAAAGLALVEPTAALQGLRALLGRDAGAVIADLDLQPVIGASGGDPHLASRPFAGIVEQVAEQLAQVLRLAREPQRFRRQRDLDLDVAIAHARQGTRQRFDRICRVSPHAEQARPAHR